MAANTTIAVQGFGNAGATLAELLAKGGYKVLGVSDSQGGIYGERGLDIPSIRQYKKERRGIKAVYCILGLLNKDIIMNCFCRVGIAHQMLFILVFYFF